MKGFALLMFLLSAGSAYAQSPTVPLTARADFRRLHAALNDEFHAQYVAVVPAPTAPARPVGLARPEPPIDATRAPAMVEFPSALPAVPGTNSP